MRFIFRSLLFIFLISSLFAGDVFQLDPAHSSINFYVKHMVISTVPGEFKDFTANIEFDRDDPTQMKAEVVIDAASINTDNPKRDRHLKSKDFLDVANYPQITFRSKKVEKKGDDEYVMIGDLTIRDVTREVKLPFRVNGVITDPRGDTRVGMEGEMVLNRQDFGVSWSRTLDNGGLVVSNDVKIKVNIEAFHPNE